jgi:hypothetical protein
VIGFKSNPKPCDEWAVFVVGFASLPIAVAVVWRVRDNVLHTAPCDFTNPAFQAWYTSKTIIGNSLFGAFAHDKAHPHKLRPDLADTDIIDCHSDAYNPLAPIPPIFTETAYASVMLPPVTTPPQYSGLRTSKENKLTGATKYRYLIQWTYVPLPPGAIESRFWYEYQDEYIEPADYPGYQPRTGGPAPCEYYSVDYANWEMHSSGGFDYQFYGPLGLMGSYTSSKDGVLYEWGLTEGTDVDIPWWTSVTNSAWSDAKNFAMGRHWYGSSASGRFSDRTIVNVCMVHYTPCSYYYKYQGGYYEAESWTFDPGRIILVQAQAIWIPAGTTGHDWVASGRNMALEAQLEAAIEMAYSLNSVPGNEIRDCHITTSIVQ